MPLRNGSRQIATPPVERTQYTTSSEPDDEKDSTPDPRQASGSYHGSKHSPEATREPSGSRTLSEVSDELNTVSKTLLELCRQGYDDENSRQQSGCTTRLKELQREFSLFFSLPPKADLASPLPPVEDPEDSGNNFNEHSYDRSAQWEVSTPPSNYISTASTQPDAPNSSSIASIQGEDPNDPEDKNISKTRQGRVSCMVKPNSTPSITAIPKATVTTGQSPNNTPRLLYEDLQDSDINLGPDNFWHRPPNIDHELAIIACEMAEGQKINIKPETQSITDNPILAEIANNCKSAKVTNILIGSTEYNNIRSIMTKVYASMHAIRPGVLVLQGIG
jgi:hypothetical protein